VSITGNFQPSKAGITASAVANYYYNYDSPYMMVPAPDGISKEPFPVTGHHQYSVSEYLTLMNYVILYDFNLTNPDLSLLHAREAAVNVILEA
jgi:hypothetical protein